MAWAVVLLPTLSALGLVSLVRRRRLLAPLAVAALGLTTAVGVWAAASGAAARLAWGPRLGLTLEIVGLARVMVVLVPAVAVAVVAYTGAHLADDPALRRLLGVLVGFVGAMELLVAAADLLTLLVAWELVGAASWALIGHDWRDAERPRCALHAFLTTRTGDLGLYLAAGAALTATGSLSYDSLAGAGRPELDAVAAGLLLAAAAKSAQLPFAPWLFSAMAGPTPVSALLHSATMVAAGAYALARLAPVLEPVSWFAPAVAGVGLATALAGGVVALVQSDLKRALAASTSAQYGLMFVAVGAGVPAAAGTHLVTHAAFKALLFLGAGVALHAAGTGALDRLRLGSALPRVAAFFAVGAAALAAVPPLGGAFSKEQLLAAAAHSSAWLGLGVLAAGGLSALYAARLHLLAFGPGPARAVSSRPRPAELAALAALAGASVLLGVLWLPGSTSVVADLVGGPLAEGQAWELGASLATVAAGLGGAWLLAQRGALASLGVAPRVQ
ncbi:MAG: proton-conducting membrane transporter, partial [Actinobacteria bacterium]